MKEEYKFDNIKYKFYSEHEHFIILYDKFDETFCIHSKDIDNDVGMITNFPLASDAIDFAVKRVKNIEKSSKVL